MAFGGPALSFTPGPYSAHVIQVIPRGHGNHASQDDAWGDLDEE
jgi:hypothetical protein